MALLLAIGLVTAPAQAQGLGPEAGVAQEAQEDGDTHAETGLPRWELGVGMAMVDFPLYRGAAERQRYWLPTPYVQYRGDYLQVDRERMRSPLLERDSVEIDLSLNGSVPVDSSESRARRGMDDLDPTLELGPELRWVLLRDERRTARRGDTFIDLRVPLRPVFAVSLDRFEQVGWLTQPTLNLALDDFGTGYSSLNYLKRLPVSELKIDRAFVIDVARGGRDGALAAAVITLGRELGLQVVAEGVETEEQSEFLSGRGCVLQQGYLHSRPVPQGDFEAMLRAA
jgi:hypothetical protein